jgi:hypothetical protein
MSMRSDRKLWNIEALRHRLDRELAADARFRANFDYTVEAGQTASDCNRCGWQTSGPLDAVRSESVAHLDEAHGLVATAW